MKRWISGFLTCLLLCGLVITVSAKTGKVTQELTYRDIRVSLDGEVLDLRNAAGDKVEPFMFDGTNYLPVRALAEALGLNVAWDGKEVMVVLTTPKPVQKDVYNSGETWTVPGQWELTGTGVTKTEARNQFSDKNPAAVYVVDYTYKNLGWSKEYFSGVFFGMDDTIVDSAGEMGYEYPGEKTFYAQETPIGATCKAQVVVGVTHEGNFTITEEKFDTSSNLQRATFAIAVE